MQALSRNTRSPESALQLDPEAICRAVPLTCKGSGFRSSRNINNDNNLNNSHFSNNSAQYNLLNVSGHSRSSDNNSNSRSKNETVHLSLVLDCPIFKPLILPEKKGNAYKILIVSSSICYNHLLKQQDRGDLFILLLK
jgi:hypothetical protein